MNEIKCIFCHLKSDRVAIEENGYQGKRCPQCELIYISPRPSLDEIFDLYGHNEAHISAQAHIAADFAKRLSAKHNLNLVRSVINKGSLLEIGAGAGYFLDEARKIGFDPYGLEFNPVQANFVRDRLNIPCQESALSTSVFGGKKFDLVYHCDVISHFFDPLSEFKKMHAVMKDESFLIFETGNFAEVDPKYYQYIPSFQYPDHLFFFSMNNLSELLKQTGFELIEIHRYSLSPQLVTMKTLSNLKDSLKKILAKSSTTTPPVKSSEVNKIAKTNADAIASQSTPSQITVKQRAKNLYKYAYQYLNYFLRYKIGSIAPKTNRPQTVIVIARKIGVASQ